MVDPSPLVLSIRPSDPAVHKKLKDKRKKDKKRGNDDDVDDFMAPEDASSHHRPHLHHDTSTFVGMVEIPLLQTMKLRQQMQQVSNAAATGAALMQACSSGGGAPPGPEAALSADMGLAAGAVSWYPLRRRVGTQVGIYRCGAPCVLPQACPE